MIAFWEGLKARYDGHPIGAATDGIYLGEAPRRAKAPYTIVEMSTVPEETMSPGVDYETIFVSFFIVSEQRSPDEAGTLYALLQNMMDEDWPTLTVAGYTVIRIDRQRSQPWPMPDKGWEYEVAYKVELSKN